MEQVYQRMFGHRNRFFQPDIKRPSIFDTALYWIGSGSLLAGWLTKTFSLKKCFCCLCLVFLIGALLIDGAQNFWMLIAGAMIAGFASGADLPISLTKISHDAPDEKISAERIASTLTDWTIGILAAMLAAFAASALAGALSGRIAAGILALISAIALLYRLTNKTLKMLEEQAESHAAIQNEPEEKVSVWKTLSNKTSLALFICILVFYCGWNLLANTFGQFQTFMLVKADASQTFATGAGIILNLICLVVAAILSKMASGRPLGFFACQRKRGFDWMDQPVPSSSVYCLAGSSCFSLIFSFFISFHSI